MTDFQWTEANVESIQFKAIKVCGVSVPTEKIINAILNTMPDLNSKFLFCGSSNFWADTNDIIFNPEKYLSVYKTSGVVFEPHAAKSFLKTLELRLRLIEIDKIQSQITAFDLNSLTIVKALMSWHEDLRGNYTGVDTQQLRKATSRQVKALKGLVDPSSVKFPRAKDYSHLIRVGEHLTPDEYLPCREYLDASNYMKLFCKAVDDLSITNTDIRESEIEIADIYKQLASIEGNDKSPSIHFFQCPYCKEHVLVRGGKQTSSCHSPECDLKYDALIKRKTRSSNHSDESGSFEPGFGGVRKRCKDCKKRRTVTDNRICEKCFLIW